ncbi:hypothetical protein PL321_07320 [Caloramator sp. mosi_1]|uniref:HMA2 domain-containing protein n=1 Tax=Caloramator sp. mosi_1 TaxID=3023090 RepID=UPI00235FF4DE|nr:hypothetical protein [Caloramator sp. mosi_1]WDC85254.1 hypothetical protein PL321_07320 [Caloramator sp. mosi_1]
MQVISSLPGRVRLKNPYIYYDKDLSEYINFYLETLVGVNYSKVNHNSATILIEYDKDKINLDEIMKKLTT